MQHNSLPDQLVVRCYIRGKTDPAYISYKKLENQYYELVKHTDNLSFSDKIIITLRNLINHGFPYYSEKELINEIETSSGDIKILPKEELDFLETSLGYKFFD